MHNAIQEIFTPVAEEIAKFKAFFRENLISKEPLLSDVTSYLSKGEGKQIRPLLVLLSAKMHGEVNHSTYIAATSIEMVHTATLIHDDIVDNSSERRGRKSVQAQWEPQVAVLAGDYLLAKALDLAIQNSEYELLRLVTKAVKEMSEGELVQMSKAESLDTTEEEYLGIIYKKTASLLSSCASTGTRSIINNNDTVDIMREVGRNIGMAFQIRDDIFDYEAGNLTGKSAGNDIKEHKLTLPLIYALQQVDENEKRQVLASLLSSNEHPEKVDEVISFVHRNGGIIYAEQEMKGYCNKAIELLSQFPDNAARSSLIKLASYTATRKS